MRQRAGLCCRELSSLSGSRSPFAKMVVLGFYDGPTSGVAECTHCDSVYVFDTLAWDDAQDMRIYALSSLPREAMDELVNLLSVATSEAPRWPVWVPIWRFTSPVSEDHVRRQVDLILSRAGPPSFVVASENLARTI